MSNLTRIDKTIVENGDFTNPSEDITIRIDLGGNEELLFTAEKEFFTPRRIATNKADVVKMEHVVEYTPNHIPVVKVPTTITDIINPQYYLNSIVQDVYKKYPVDTFFVELDDELAAPDFVGTDEERRQLALNSLLNLERQATAAISGDSTEFQDSADAIDENYSSQAAMDEIAPLAPDEIVSPEEEDQLSALDFVGLSDPSEALPYDDVIDPTPIVNETDLIQFGTAIPKIAGKIAGTETINKAITLLNSGVQQVEDSTQTGVDEEGKCKQITVAPGKKGKKVLGVKITKGKTERKVSRSETADKLAKIKADIAAQEASSTTIINPSSGVPMLVKVQKAGLFGKLVGGIAKVAGILPLIGNTVSGAINGVIPKGMKPMTKQQALDVLNKTKNELEGILDKEC